MSVELCIAYVGLYTYLGVHYGVLYARKRSHPEHLWFGALAASLALYNGSLAWLLTTSSVLESSHAQRLALCTLALVSAFYVHFAAVFSGQKRPGVLKVVYALLVFALLMSALGPTVDPTRPLVPPAFGFANAPSPPRASPTWIGGVSLIGYVTAGTYGYFMMRALGRHAADTRIVAVSSALNLVVGLHDTAIFMGWIHSVTMLEHALLFWFASVSYILIGRTVATQNELERKTEALRQAFVELQETQRELARKESLATVGELSAVIAHEVRNPLAIIKNATSGLRRRRTVGEADAEVLLRILDEETDRLNRLVKDLLAFARPIEVQRRPVAVSDLVHRAVETAHAGTSLQVDITTRIELRDDASEVHCDPDLLRQALVNVIENAIQAMPAGGTLTVRSLPTRHESRRFVSLEIRDTGEGMDTLVRQKALAPFFTTRPAGTGLGLAIVERLVRAHGGVLDIESRHGTGTTVTIRLPHPDTSIPAAPPSSAA